MKGNTVAPSLHDRSCLLHSCGDAGEVLMVQCQYDVAPERAVACVRALFASTCPEQVGRKQFPSLRYMCDCACCLHSNISFALIMHARLAPGHHHRADIRHHH